MEALSSTISAADFIKLKENNSGIVVIDVRTAAEFNNEYFPGCLHFAVQQITPERFELFKSTHGIHDKQPLFFLCGSGKRAAVAVEQLDKAIPNSLVIIEGGVTQLKGLGANLKKGAGNVISLERQVRIAAGTLVLTGVVAGALLSPVLYGVSAFVGAGLIFAGVTDTCGMGMLLARMPWNALQQKNNA